MAQHQFTAAAARALAAARKWTVGESGHSFSAPELLLGLLDETESRASEMLAAHGIDALEVLTRWPHLSPSTLPDNGQPSGFSPRWQEALAAATSRLDRFPRPLELATEHLLLGLVAGYGEVSDWLKERGFDADALADEICRLYGYGGNGQVDPLGAAQVFPAEHDHHSDDFSEPADAVEGTNSALAGEEPGNDAPSGISTVDGECAACPPINSSAEHTSVLRLIDAATNRAREGLRVLEDFVRFVWNDRHLTAQLKQLRHDLAAALSEVAGEDFLASRDTLADVGTNVATDAEGTRADLASVVTANAKRLQESLRSLEEYGKLLSPSMSAKIEQIRYRAYTVERALGATALGRTRLAAAQFYVLIDGGPSLAAFARLVEELIAAGVDVLQLRDKGLADGELLQRARRLRELTLGTRTLFVMNDRADLAALARADGIHVGQDELSVAACRAIVGPRALIGVSTHSLEQARRAVLDGANYIGVGPTFASRTKKFDEQALRGSDLLRAVNAEVSVPAFAIGGIDQANLPEVLTAGFRRIAVSGAVLSAESPGEAARTMIRRLR